MLDGYSKIMDGSAAEKCNVDKISNGLAIEKYNDGSAPRFLLLRLEGGLRYRSAPSRTPDFSIALRANN